MGLVGCYNIHLYCDHPDHIIKYGEPEEYNGNTENHCIKQARSWGWIVNKRKEGDEPGLYYCVCPFHSGKVKKE